MRRMSGRWHEELSETEIAGIWRERNVERISNAAICRRRFGATEPTKRELRDELARAIANTAAIGK